MPTDPAFTAWIPPEGCDVLAERWGSRPPLLIWHSALSRWLPRDHVASRFDEPDPDAAAPGGDMAHPFANGMGALWLAESVKPVPAGMDAGRRVLAEALGMDASGGVILESDTEPPGPVIWWATTVRDRFYVYDCEHTTDPAKALAPALAHHRGGRAVFADSNGREEAP